MRIAVVGAGAWGTALAQVWAVAGNEVTLIARDEQAWAQLNVTRRAPRLPGVLLHDGMTFAVGPEKVAGHALVAFVVPAQTFPDVAMSARQCMDEGATALLCAKGIDASSGRSVAQSAALALPDHDRAVLSGPSFAHDVARGRPTAVTLAGQTMDAAVALSEDLSTPALRLYASDDIEGVEAGGALKNVMALAVGAARGLDLGASAEAALIARGFAEMVPLAVAMGGRRETLAGLSGLGDLVLTCGSPQSRNFAYGEAMARRKDLADRPLAEGVYTARAALDLARRHGLDTPIIAAVCAVLEERMSVGDAVASLLARPLKTEIS
ncbi:MAG: NAD(P)H-dependent glycerol-3-phosphate dehydrogenase [Pseudomonadota bacterium]